MLTSQLLAYLRIKRGLSAKDVASLAELSPMAISYYESGERTPNENNLERICTVLGINPSLFPCNIAPNANLSPINTKAFLSLPKKSQEATLLEANLLASAILEFANRLNLPLPKLQVELSSLPSINDPALDAVRLRNALCLPSNGPLGNLSRTLETIGIYPLLFHASEVECELSIVGDNRLFILAPEADDFSKIRVAIVKQIAISLFKNHLDNKYLDQLVYYFLLPEQEKVNHGEKSIHAYYGLFGNLQEESSILLPYLYGDCLSKGLLIGTEKELFSFLPLV